MSIIERTSERKDRLRLSARGEITLLAASAVGFPLSLILASTPPSGSGPAPPQTGVSSSD